MPSGVEGRRDNTRELAFLARTVGEVVARRSAECDMEGLDWAFLLPFARAQRVLGFFAHVLRMSGRASRLPRPIQVVLHAEAQACRTRNIDKTTYFASLGARLASAEIRVMPLKGTSLSYSVYGDAPLRTMVDTDVLVHPDDAASARAWLKAWGVVPDAPPLPNRWHGEIQWRFGRAGRRAYRDGAREVDVHVRPVYLVDGATLELDWAGLWQRAAPLAAVPGAFSMASADELAFVLLHALDGYAPSLVQLLDVAMLSALSRGALAEHGMSSRHFARLHALRETSVALFDPQGAPFEVLEATQRFLTPSDVRRRGVPWSALPPRVLPRFFAGYLVPDREYYAGMSLAEACVSHARHVMGRAGEAARVAINAGDSAAWHRTSGS